MRWTWRGTNSGHKQREHAARNVQWSALSSPHLILLCFAAARSHIPPYGSREVLLLLSALSTVDPGDVMDSIAACAAAHMTCSVISLAAEMYVATLMASTTGGEHAAR